MTATAKATTVDYRLPERRRGAFHDFYELHLRYGAHPGAVYMLLPYLRARLGWTDEEALWFAFLNGNTQNPVTSLLLHRAGCRPADADAVVACWKENYARLAFDTDRRYHKKAFDMAVASYLALVGEAQRGFWQGAAQQGFRGVWDACSRIHTFGRLSAFSYAEYLRVMGLDFDCDDLMLGDMAGSRSHRNGLCILLGLDHLDWHASNPGFTGVYPADLLARLDLEAAVLLQEAQARAVGKPWARDVSYFTLESTLCTYKGWHRPNRRYPGVYLDMLHDRIRAAETAWPDEDLSIFWAARAELLPVWLRLEDRPHDPGLHPLKQNHYRLTGEIPVLGHDYPAYWSSFDEAVERGELGTFR